MVRKINGRIARITRDSVDRGDLKAVEHGLLAGLTLFGIVGILLALSFSGAGVAVSTYLLPRFGAQIRARLQRAPPGAAADRGGLRVHVRPDREDRRHLLPDDGDRVRGDRALPVGGLTMRRDLPAGPPQRLEAPVPDPGVLELRGHAERRVRLRHPPRAAGDLLRPAGGGAEKREAAPRVLQHPPRHGGRGPRGGGAARGARGRRGGRSRRRSARSRWDGWGPWGRSATPSSGGRCARWRPSPARILALVHPLAGIAALLRPVQRHAPRRPAPRLLRGDGGGRKRRSNGSRRSR